MAAPKDAGRKTVFRTKAPPLDREPRPFTPSYRKLAFETQAAGSSAVGAELLLNARKEDRGPERQAPRAQAKHFVTMTSVVKKAYSVQPSSVRSSGSQPADAQTQAASKSLLPIKIKDVDVSRHLHSGDSENDIKVIKPRRENGLMKAPDTVIKKNVRKGYKPLNKQKPEEELKDKNQLLEAVNRQLHQKLTETQGELKDLTQKVELLEKFQDNCLAMLESKGLNPGTETQVSQQESTTDHTDSMLLLETLKDELKTFNETATKQMEELQALKVKLKFKEEERNQFLEQQASYNDQVNDFSVILQEMEQLLEI